MSCEETHEHLESCEECRLRVVVETRLRTQPVLEPPPGLVDRILRRLPGRPTLFREFVRLAAAAVVLVGLVAGVYALGLERHDKVVRVANQAQQTFKATTSALNPFEGSLPWDR